MRYHRLVIYIIMYLYIGNTHVYTLFVYGPATLLYQIYITINKNVKQDLILLQNLQVNLKLIDKLRNYK